MMACDMVLAVRVAATEPIDGAIRVDTAYAGPKWVHR